MLAGLLPIEVLQNGTPQFGAMQRRAIVSCSTGAGKASAKGDCNCVISYCPPVRTVQTYPTRPIFRNIHMWYFKEVL
jgi:hypothetical protein